MSNSIDAAVKEDEMAGAAAQLFKSVDTDGSGTISAQELMVSMLDRGMQPEDVSALFGSLDVDGDGEITPTEWLKGYAEYLCPAITTAAKQPLSMLAIKGSSVTPPSRLLEEGAVPFSDGAYKISHTGGASCWPHASAVEPVLVPLAQADKRQADPAYVQLTTQVESAIYLFWNENKVKQGGVPAWVAAGGWERTDVYLSLNWQYASRMVLYTSPAVPAGGTVRLGGAEYSGKGNDDNYFFAVHALVKGGAGAAPTAKKKPAGGGKAGARVCVVGHDEAAPLAGFLANALEARGAPVVHCEQLCGGTADAAASQARGAAALLVVLSPRAWTAEWLVAALREGWDCGMRIVLTHLPASSATSAHGPGLAAVGEAAARVDLGSLIAGAPPQFRECFAHLEVLSVRLEAWAAPALCGHMLQALGLARYRRPAAEPDASRAPSSAIDAPSPAGADARVLYWGRASDEESPDDEWGWYSVDAAYDDGAGVARLAVEYLSRSGELGSFRCATELHWDASSGQLWQEEGEPSWYRDATWVQNRVPLLRLASGKRAPDGGLVLHSGYVGTSNTKRLELIRLAPLQFRHHFLVMGVAAEIEQTALAFATILHERSGVARSVRIVTCLEWGAGAETGGASVEELLRGASAVIVFVTASTWGQPRLVAAVGAALVGELTVLLVSQPDPRFQGHCVVGEAMAAAPPTLRSAAVHPFYRRAYEQAALLDHVLCEAGFAEACPHLSRDHNSASGLEAMQAKLLVRLDEWGSEHSQMELIGSGAWLYYEGTAGRDGQVWGWYQIDVCYCDARKEAVFLTHYQSRNPRAVPSYMSLGEFEWRPDDGATLTQKGGSWRGARDPSTKALTIKNKFGDTIVHVCQPYVYHFFLSHVQREAGEACALLDAKLDEVTTAGKKARCWYDMKAAQINAEGMRAGMRHSAAYVLFLSPSTFESKWVMFELNEALRTKKPIILLHQLDTASPWHMGLDEARTKAEAAGRAGLLDTCAALVAFASAGQPCRDCMRSILAAAGFAENYCAPP